MTKPEQKTAGSWIETFAGAQHVICLHRCFNQYVPDNWYRSDPLPIGDYHLLFVRRGQGTYFLDDREVSLDRRRVILLSPGCSFGYWHSPKRPPQVVALRFGLYDERNRSRPGRQRFAIAGYIRDELALGALCDRLHHGFVRGSQLDRRLESSIMHTILAFVHEDMEMPRQADAQVDERIQRVRDMIHGAPTERHDVATLAGIAGLSPAYFSRVFRAVVGLSPKSYQLRVRMHYARFLIESTDSSVKSVAYSMGYTDPYLFSRQFKLVLGKSPQQLRGELK